MESLRSAGARPGDSDEVRLQKSLLMLATGLICVTSMLWPLLYRQMGPQFSTTVPLVFQGLIVGNLIWYLRNGNFDLFRITQLSLFLFMPFLAQWAIGNFITASGISLWGILAPIGAILFIGARESIAWFVAYVFLLVLSGVFDFLLADQLLSGQPRVPLGISAVFFTLNFVTVSTICYLLLRYSAQERQRAQAKLEVAHLMLQAEQERSERLLLNILPGPIAERLKQENQTIADGFSNVTVMFADIVGFTHVAEGMTPQQVFHMLNRIFSAFDELAEKHGLEKIKTIGDAYMVAGGLNGSNNNDAAAIANMALDMIKLLHHDFRVNARHLDMRIGIGSGPVVAGVVGKKKFIYDLWGDTVNLASRITSEGMAGKIHVDEVTHRQLKDAYRFDAPARMHVKGKGDITVYSLIEPLIPYGAPR
jgi:class 3 adenylate cyclase